MSTSPAEQVNEIPETMQAVICHGPENPERCHPFENGCKWLVTWSLA